MQQQSAFPVPKGAVVLKRERPYYTRRGCRVQTVFYTLDNGQVIEDTVLSCPTDLNIGRFLSWLVPLVIAGSTLVALVACTARGLA